MPLNSSNKLKVISCIGRYQPVSRGELSRVTGLPSPTITNIVAEFVQENLVTEVGFQVSTGGRKPALLELTPEKSFLMGVELNAQRLTVLLIDLKANIHHKHVEVVGPQATQEQLEQRLYEAIAECLERNSDHRERIKGIGLGISGLVDSSRGVSLRFPGVSPWKEMPVVHNLHSRFGLPAFLENNVAIRTLAELWFGLGRGKSNYLYISLGPHIRMGIVINGQLYRGSSGNAGELGHTTFRSDGPLCYCGNSGCLEMYASSEALVQEVRRVLYERPTVSGSPLAEIPADRIEADHVFQAARDGDRLADSIIDRVIEPLGLSIAGLVNLFDAEAIILGGSMAVEGDLILQRIQQAIQKRSLPHLAQTVDLKVTRFGPEGGALGAGALVMQKMFAGAIPL